MRTGYKAQILAVTGRAADEGVFPDRTGLSRNDVVMPTCGEWLSEVFDGTADRLFNYALQPLVRQVGARHGGRQAGRGGRAALAELARSGAKEGFDLGAGTDDVVAHLKALYKLQRGWQDIN